MSTSRETTIQMSKETKPFAASPFQAWKQITPHLMASIRGGVIVEFNTFGECAGSKKSNKFNLLTDHLVTLIPNAKQTLFCVGTNGILPLQIGEAKKAKDVEEMKFIPYAVKNTHVKCARTLFNDQYIVLAQAKADLGLLFVDTLTGKQILFSLNKMLWREDLKGIFILDSGKIGLWLLNGFEGSFQVFSINLKTCELAFEKQVRVVANIKDLILSSDEKYLLQYFEGFSFNCSVKNLLDDFLKKFLFLGEPGNCPKNSILTPNGKIVYWHSTTKQLEYVDLNNHFAVNVIDTIEDVKKIMLTAEGWLRVFAGDKIVTYDLQDLDKIAALLPVLASVGIQKDVASMITSFGLFSTFISEEKKPEAAFFKPQSSFTASI